jgi:hypothetical protein
MKRSKSSDSGKLQWPYVTLEVLDFHNPPVSLGMRTQITGIGNRRKLRASRGFLRKGSAGLCTKSGHSPVDGLHSIENKRDKLARILLTLKTKSVELNRSLTAS